MKLDDLREQMEGRVDGFTPIILPLVNIETGETIDKFMMMRDGKMEQVFGTTQRVLDVINLTDDELIHYITEWTKACGQSLAEGHYRLSEQKVKTE